MRKPTLVLFLFLGAVGWLLAQPVDRYFDWRTLPTAATTQDTQTPPGLAGAFSGVHNNALLLAGGVSYPDSLLWEGGQKQWYDRIYVYTISEKNDTAGNWYLADIRL
ncbi:MAG: hypothetical protein AAFO94_18420, partial [Bacteroidota bacterium]